MSIFLLLIFNLIADPRLEPYLQSYKQDKAKYTGSQEINENILFVISKIENKPGKEVIGQCIRYENGALVVKIDSAFFDKGIDCAIKLVFYHEMGHCDLGLKHTEHVSIMSAKIKHIFKKFCKNEDVYIKRLFKGE